MAEVIGFGASVVAFIGLAGQVAQGCKFVRDVLCDIKDASNDIRALRTEIQLFELAVDHFQGSLAEIEAAGIPVPASYGVGIELALKYSEEAMTSLLGLIAKKAGGESIKSRIKFAFRKDNCSKHLGRLGRAKGYISTAQASILLLIQQHNTLGTRATHRALDSLASTCELSVTPLASIPGRFDEAHTQTESIRKEVFQLRNDFSSRLRDLSTGISAILSSKFSASTNIVLETRGWTETSYHNMEETRTGVENLVNPSDGLESLPMGMSELVKDTFRGVLAEFYLASRNSAHDCSPSKWGVAPTSGQPRSRRKVIQQTTSTRRYIRAIGIITVQSTTTTFLNPLETKLSDKTVRPLSTVTQTQVELNPDPDLLRMGVYLSFIQQGFAEYASHPEHNLRVFNIIDSDAPIVRACCSGDLQNVRELFASREASPLDRVWGDRSLLDLVLNRFFTSWNTPRSTDRNAFIEKLLVLFGDLVQYGLDPGQQRRHHGIYGPCPLGALATLRVNSEEDMVHIANLARIILSRSTQDPLFGFSFATINYFDYLAFKVQIGGLEIPLYTFLKTQDDWPITWTPVADLRTKFLTAIQSEADLRPGFWVSEEPNSRSYPLDELLCYDPNLSTMDRILDCYRSLEDKIRVFRNVCHILRTSQCGSIDYQNYIPRFQDKMVEKFVLCLHACQSSGLDLQNPPFEFHDVLRDFRVKNCLRIIHTALLRSGIARELIDDLLEAELYSSLAFQLANITHLIGISAPYRERFPAPLRYYNFRVLAESDWTDFWDSQYKTVTCLESSSDTESLTSLDSDSDDCVESDTWSDIQERLQYPWDYDEENCLETLFGENLELDNQDITVWLENNTLGTDADQAQGPVLTAVTEAEVEKNKEIIGIEESRCDDQEEKEINARVIIHAQPSTPDIVDERLDGIAVAWNAFWT